MALTALSNWTKFTTNADSVTFVGPQHTVQQPQTLTFTRSVPKKSQKTYSNARLNVKYTKGVLDSAGQLVGLVTIGTTGNSIPVVGVDVGSAVAEGAALMATLFADAGFVASLTTLVLPE